MAHDIGQEEIEAFVFCRTCDDIVIQHIEKSLTTGSYGVYYCGKGHKNRLRFFEETIGREVWGPHGWRNYVSAPAT